MPPKKQKRSLEAEMAEMRKQLAALSVRPKQQRSRSRGRSRSRSRNRGGMPAAQTSGPSRSTASASFTRGAHIVRVSGHEPVRKIIAKQGKTETIDFVDVNPGNTVLGPELHALSKIFSQYRPVKLRFTYEPMVGTTVGGGVTMGLTAPNHKGNLKAFSDIAAMQPNVSGPLYQKRSLVIPKSMLDEKRWYEIDKEAVENDGSPVILCWCVDSDANSSDKAYGRLWVEYEYLFQSFRSTS
ncbi:MAG: coat protein [Hangzhou tombus-like virus 2]|nr:MAG: coat protein [Hangzhou tombus-like virus 2]